MGFPWIVIVDGNPLRLAKLEVDVPMSFLADQKQIPSGWLECSGIIVLDDLGASAVIVSESIERDKKADIEVTATKEAKHFPEIDPHWMDENGKG